MNENQTKPKKKTQPATPINDRTGKLYEPIVKLDKSFNLVKTYKTYQDIKDDGFIPSAVVRAATNKEEDGTLYGCDFLFSLEGNYHHYLRNMEKRRAMLEAQKKMSKGVAS